MKTQATAVSVGNLGILGDDFRRSLRAANKSPKTVKTYMEAVNARRIEAKRRAHLNRMTLAAMKSRKAGA